MCKHTIFCNQRCIDTIAAHGFFTAAWVKKRVNSHKNKNRNQKIDDFGYFNYVILILIALLGISKVTSSESKSLLLLDVVTIASAVEILLIPKLIGSCGMSSMLCNTGTMPVLTISSLLLILIFIISIIGNVLSKQSREEAEIKAAAAELKFTALSRELYTTILCQRKITAMSAVQYFA